MTLMSTVGTYGVDYWFHRESGFKAWVCSVVNDTGYSCLLGKKSQKKEDDIVVVEAEEKGDINGEAVRREMETERRLQGVRAVFAGLALSMGIVGLWGDRRP
jgi:autophagy-related protein 33